MSSVCYHSKTNTVTFMLKVAAILILIIKYQTLFTNFISSRHKSYKYQTGKIITGGVFVHTLFTSLKWPLLEHKMKDSLEPLKL